MSNVHKLIDDCQVSKVTPAQKPSELPTVNATKTFKSLNVPQTKSNAVLHRAETVLLDKIERGHDKKILPLNVKSSFVSNRIVPLRKPPMKKGIMADGGDRAINSEKPKQARPGLAPKLRANAVDSTSIPTRTRSQWNCSVVANGGAIQKRAESAKTSKAESMKAEEGVPSLREMAAHLKRLTEEHAKLQTEYARVRTLLQDANIKSTSRIGSPIPPDKVEPNGICLAPGDAEMEKPAPKVELERGISEENEEDDGSASTKDGFRREVLRLKEELLAAQQQLASVTEIKSASEQELSRLSLKFDEVGHELVTRDNLIEQLSRQVVQVKARFNMQKAEHMQKLEEDEERQVALTLRLKEAEHDSRETKEFMQEEINSLAEALRESEERAASYHLELGRQQFALEAKAKHCQVLSQVVEQTQAQLQLLQSELADTQDGAKELLLKQGAELNGCSIAIRRIHQLVEGITRRILHDAEALGVDVGPDEASRKRRSNDGRKLVWAILQAARVGEMDQTNGGETSGKTPAEFAGVNGKSSVDEGNFSLTTQVKEVESSIGTLGKIQQTVNQFLFTLLNEAENEKIKLENDLNGERKRLDEMQTELEENCKRRWALEEVNKEQEKELASAKDGLKESYDALKDMWDKIDEKANWLIENKKLKEEVDLVRKHNHLLEGKIGLLKSELQEVVSQQDSAKQKNSEAPIGDFVVMQTTLKEEILKLQHQLREREEEFCEKSQKHERHQQVVNGNLQKAEDEVRRLDAIIDHVLQVFKNATDLQTHPVLKQLWVDLDGESFADSTAV